MFKIGYGEDSHALEKGKVLTIGNLKIKNSPHGTIAHSDGDVLLHALSDALLSAFALGDIGKYFPPSDMQYKDLDSKIILAKVLELIDYKNIEINNIAAVVILDTPKLGSSRPKIQKRLAELLNIDVNKVGITFKTSEGLAERHVQARVTVLLRII